MDTDRISWNPWRWRHNEGTQRHPIPRHIWIGVHLAAAPHRAAAEFGSSRAQEKRTSPLRRIPDLYSDLAPGFVEVDQAPRMLLGSLDTAAPPAQQKDVHVLVVFEHGALSTPQRHDERRSFVIV